MGLFEWLLQAAVQTAITAAAVWLIKETVSYFITRSRLRDIVLRKKVGSQFQKAIKFMVTHNDGHEVDFDFFDSYDTNLGGGTVTSDAGVSYDIRVGDVILL